MIPVMDKLHLDAYIGSLVILAICYPLIFIFNKYFPWFTGKMK